MRSRHNVARRRIPRPQVLLGGLVFLGLFGLPGVAQAEEVKDRDITDAVDSRLMRDPAVFAHNVNVETDRGIVTLTGAVNNLLARDRAEKIAESIKGVRSVVNRIEVQPVARDDGAIGKDVERALLADPATEAYEVNESVTDGVVTLNGTVHSWQEKQLAGVVAKGVRGVRDVQNKVGVRYRTNRSDSEIAADVRRRLERDVYVDDGRIDVKVEEGAVQLSGTVGSAEERSRAYADAWVAGVQSVDSEGLVVDKWWAREELRRVPGAEEFTDKEIREAVLAAFLYDPRVQSFKPEVTVHDGAVTLRGLVDNRLARQAAEDDARNTAGVWRVRNFLKVRPRTDVPPADLVSEVKAALGRNPYVSDHDITVRVFGGVVYLSGEVDSYYERWRAEDAAAGVQGVVDVRNGLRITETQDRRRYDDSYRPRPSLTRADQDREILADIRDELFWSPWVDREEVRVLVKDGVATLEGTVDSTSEKRAATENAFEGGATSVVNNLKIEGR